MENQTFNRKAGRIAFFATLSYMVDYSFQLVDIYWVSKVGTGAATAIAIISSFFFLILSLNEIIGVSTVPLFSQAAGSGDKERTGLVILQSTIAKLVLGLGLAVVFLAFLFFLAPLYQINSKTRAYLYDYGNIIWMSLVLVPVYSTLMTALRAIGEEAKTFAISIMALLLNAALNPVLIFGWGNWPGLGVSGSAWATIVAQIGGLTAAVFFLGSNRLGIPVFRLRHLTWNPSIYRQLIWIGLPVGGVMILYNIEQTAITAIAAGFSTDVSDGYGIGARIFGLLFMAIFGLSVGISVTVGHYIGRGEIAEVRSRLPKFVLACVVGICLFAFGMFGHARELVSAFTNSVTAISTGAEYLRYMAITICFLTALYSVNGAFEGAGRNLPVLMVASVMYLGVELPLILWLMQRPDFALSDVWTAVTISTLVGAVFTAWLFHRDLWVPATPIIRDLNSEGFK